MTNISKFKSAIVLQSLSLGILGTALGVEYYRNIFAKGFNRVDGEVILEEEVKSRFSNEEVEKIERTITVQWEQNGELYTKRLNDQDKQYELGDSYPLWVSSNVLGYAIEYRDKHKATGLKFASLLMGGLAVGLAYKSYTRK